MVIYPQHCIRQKICTFAVYALLTNKRHTNVHNLSAASNNLELKQKSLYFRTFKKRNN